MTSKLKTDVLETVSGSGTIALTNQLSGMTSASMPSGSVIQVISTHVTDTFATTSTSYVDITGMTVSITPSSTSSKILVQVIGQAGNLTGGYMTMVQLTRNGTAIAGGPNVSNRPSAFSMSRASSVDTAETVGGVYLDSPSSTSAVVYKLQMKVQGETGTFNRTGRDVDTGYTPRTAASILVQEIKG
jgi:hypothetical protein